MIDTRGGRREGRRVDSKRKNSVVEFATATTPPRIRENILGNQHGALSQISFMMRIAMGLLKRKMNQLRRKSLRSKRTMREEKSIDRRIKMNQEIKEKQ